MTNLYDIAFIGAGLSCSYTLIHYLNALKEVGEPDRLTLLIVDKAGEFWTGIPYGMRSGSEPLIITSLGEFLPEEERKRFEDWLRKNVNWTLGDSQKKGVSLCADWLNNNTQLITSGLWEKIFIPRHIFGIYLKERLQTMLDLAAEAGWLEYVLVHGDVTDVSRGDDFYDLEIHKGCGTRTISRTNKLILSIGSPPTQKISCPNSLAVKGEINDCLIDDIYHPSIATNVCKIADLLRTDNKTSSNNLLVVGSNASALELLYNIRHLFVAGNLINKIFVLSSDAAFPNPIHAESKEVNYIPANLRCLVDARCYTSGDILNAVKLDTEAAHKEKVSISNIYHDISRLVIHLFNKLDNVEQKKFVSIDGVEIGKFQRRAGLEYLNIADNLIKRDKMILVKGRLTQLITLDEGYFKFQYCDKITGKEEVFPVSIKVAINCTGSENLDKSSSLLISKLIDRGICKINESNKGFEVDKNYQANKNLFVIGPLLAGNLNERIRVWHAESCSRIFFLSRQLAESLMEDLQSNLIK